MDTSVSTRPPLAVLSLNKQGQRQFSRYIGRQMTDKAVFLPSEAGDPEQFAILLENFRLNGLSEAEQT